MSTRDSVQIPDDRDFDHFRTECNSDDGWSLTYNKSGIVVWIQILEAEKALHKIKVRNAPWSVEGSGPAQATRVLLWLQATGPGWQGGCFLILLFINNFSFPSLATSTFLPLLGSTQETQGSFQA